MPLPSVAVDRTQLLPKKLWAMRAAVTTKGADEEGVFDFGLHTPEAASEGEMVALERFDSLEEKGKSFVGVCEATD